MNLGSVNWLAVIVCVVVSMISGSIWYNPKTFFPTWWKVVGAGREPGMGNMGMTWGLTILSSFVQAVAMAIMVNALGITTAGAGAGIGFMFCFGFVAPTNLVNKLFAGHGLKIWAIEVGNHFVNFVLFGAILGAWH